MYSTDTQYAIQNLRKSETLAIRNPNSYDRKASWTSVNIRRETKNGKRLAVYNPEDGSLIHVVRSFPGKDKYSFTSGEFYKDYGESIIYDTKGHYYKDFGKKKPFKTFSNFREMLAYFRSEKAKQTMPENRFVKIFKNLLNPNFDDIIVEPLARNLKGNAKTRQIKRKKSLLKPVEGKIRTKVFAHILYSILPLYIMTAVNPIIGASFLGLNFSSILNLLGDKSKLRKTPLFKEYKNLIVSPEYKEILLRAKKIFH